MLPFTLPKSLRRRAGAALLGAVFLAPTTVAAVAGDASHPAAAQGRLEAEYIASIAGIPIGRGNWIIEIYERPVHRRGERHDDRNYSLLHWRTRHRRGAWHA